MNSLFARTSTFASSVPSDAAPSAARIAANRANAQKSTGPRTPEGKEKSAANATTHGLTASLDADSFRSAGLRTEAEQHDLNAFSARLLPELNAQTELERELSGTIVLAMWRLRRIADMEENLFFTLGRYSLTGDLDKYHHDSRGNAFIGHGPAFNNLSLYEQRLSRLMHKNLEALRKLQREREANAAKQPSVTPAQPEKAMAAGVNNRVQSIQNTASAPENGFVFSTPPAAASTPPRSNVAAV